MSPISIRICFAIFGCGPTVVSREKVDTDTLTAGMNGYRITSMAVAPPSGYLSRNPHYVNYISLFPNFSPIMLLTLACAHTYTYVQNYSLVFIRHSRNSCFVYLPLSFSLAFSFSLSLSLSLSLSIHLNVSTFSGHLVLYLYRSLYLSLTLCPSLCL